MSAPYVSELRSALRSQTLQRHIEQHSQYGSDFEKCPNVNCQDASALLKRTAEPEPDSAGPASAQASG